MHGYAILYLWNLVYQADDRLSPLTDFAIYYTVLAAGLEILAWNFGVNSILHIDPTFSLKT